MSQTRLPPALRSLPAPVVALLALALGALIGLAAVTPLLGGLGAPSERLTGWLLPIAGISLLMVVSLRSPLAGLLLTVLLAPYSRFIPFDLDLGSGIPALSLPRLMAGFLLLLLLYQAVRGQRRLRPLTWPDLAFVVFLAALTLSVAELQYDSTFAFQSLLDAYVLPFVFLYLARQIVRNLGDLRWFSATLVLAGVGFAFLVIREQLTGEVLFYSREAAALQRQLPESDQPDGQCGADGRQHGHDPAAGPGAAGQGLQQQRRAQPEAHVGACCAACGPGFHRRGRLHDL